jgi:hypothetical protein
MVGDRLRKKTFQKTRRGECGRGNAQPVKVVEQSQKGTKGSYKNIQEKL